MRIGLTGLVGFGGGGRQAADRMYEQLFPVGGARRLACDPGAGTVFSLRVAPWVRAEEVHSHRGALHLLVVGEARGVKGTLTAAGLLDLWQRAGPDSLIALGGAFVLVLWDAERLQLKIASDRLGMEKLYYYATTQGVLLATELGALLAHPACPRGIDDVAVAQFLTASHLIESRSMVQGVQIVPPASVVEWHGGQLTTRRYWYPSAGHAEEATVDAWAERLQGVLAPVHAARSDDTDILLPLSGGLDSRCVASFLPPAARPRTVAYSFGPRACYDVRFGRAVARALGIAHRRLPVPRTFFRDDLELAARLTDGEVSIEALPVLQLRHVATGSRALLHGFLGDVLSGGHLLPATALADPASAREQLWRQRYVKMGFDDTQLADVLVPERARHVAGAMRQTVMDALDRADAETLEERALLIELEHRQARYISYLQRALSAYGPCWTPFLEAQVVDVFLALPLVHRRGQHAYRRMLRARAPELAALPEAKTGRAMTDMAEVPRSAASSPLATLPILWRIERLKRRLLEQAERRAGGWVSHRRRLHYVQLEDCARIVDPGWFRARLLDRELIEGWFQAATLARLLDEHLAGRANHAVRLNNVVSFLEWRRSSGL